MRPIVARLSAIQTPDQHQAAVLAALGEEAAEPGLYYLLDDLTQEIIEPAWLFLKAKYGSVGRKTDDNPVPSFSSNRQTAYALSEWFAFLHALKHGWRSANHERLLAFAGYQASRLSPHSGKKRTRETIGMKLGVVTGFYSYTNAARLTDVRWDRDTIAARYGTRRNNQDKADENAKPFSLDEVPTIRKALGLQPSELPTGSLRTTRDRLLLETGLLTGMRGEEICYLRAKGIKRLKPDVTRPNATQPIRIKVTKGRVWRTVGLPNRLIVELQAYIAGERARCLSVLTSRGEPDHGYLFVNLESSAKPGGKLKTPTIHRMFNGLMRKLGMTEDQIRTKRGVKVTVKVTTHSFHDTRHTFAVRYYVGLKQQLAQDPAALNFAEPWEIVQIALGHADWETTRKHYLRHVGEYEAQIGVRVHDWLGDL